jgi:hypothetical protein
MQYSNEHASANHPTLSQPRNLKLPTLRFVKTKLNTFGKCSSFSALCKWIVETHTYKLSIVKLSIPINTNLIYWQQRQPSSNINFIMHLLIHLTWIINQLMIVVKMNLNSKWDTSFSLAALVRFSLYSGLGFSAADAFVQFI